MDISDHFVYFWPLLFLDSPVWVKYNSFFYHFILIS